MSKKRRMFDIDVPEDVPEAAPVLETKSATPTRRGPMATAVRENADAVRERVAAETEARAENDRLAHEHVRLKRLGLITDAVPLEAIDTTKLRRDRGAQVDPELADLVASIREIGLSNPIRVEQVGDRYELIQGWRRLQAYRALHAETGEDRWAAIPAGMVAAGDDLSTSYRRMVDENLVRKDISFAEMAMLARDFAADPGIACDDVGEAVAILYASAGKQKRSYIRAFGELLDMLDKDLMHAEAMPRNLGLAVRRQIAEGNPGLADLVAALRQRPARTEAQELSILRGFIGGGGGGESGEVVAPTGPGRAPAAGARKAKTTFRIALPSGELKCSAADGKLELKGDADFTRYDRRRLELAVAAFFDALEEDAG